MTKKTIKMKDIILEHYQKVHELEMHGLTVRVWKPRTMQQLPAYMMLHVLQDFAREARHWCATEKKAEWFYGCADYCVYDIKFVRYVDPRHKTLDVYVAAALIRPFSREAYEWYDRHDSCGLTQTERLMLMWDSREYDRINGFDTSFGKPCNWDEWKDTLYCVEDKERDLADLSEDYYAEDSEEPDCLVFKLKHTDESVEFQASWPKGEKGEKQAPDRFLELNAAAVDYYGKIHKEHPEFKEVHFYTEPTEWEDDETEE